MKKKEKGPKKLFLNDYEKQNINSRKNLLAEHQFYTHMLNNSIVEFLKEKVYPRLGLDKSKDYPLANDGTYLLIEEEEKNESK